jgi:hypothetical protein
MGDSRTPPFPGAFWVNLLGPLSILRLGRTLAGGISATASAAPLIR